MVIRIVAGQRDALKRSPGAKEVLIGKDTIQFGGFNNPMATTAAPGELRPIERNFQKMSIIHGLTKLRTGGRGGRDRAQFFMGAENGIEVTKSAKGMVSVGKQRVPELPAAHVRIAGMNEADGKNKVRVTIVNTDALIRGEGGGNLAI